MTTYIVVRLRAGWGYWDITQYPRGGCFRRLDKDTTLTVDAEQGGEYYGKLPDGRRICITKRALENPAPTPEWQIKNEHDLYLTHPASGWCIERPSGKSIRNQIESKETAENILRASGYEFMRQIGNAGHWRKK